MSYANGGRIRWDVTQTGGSNGTRYQVVSIHLPRAWNKLENEPVLLIQTENGLFNCMAVADCDSVISGMSYSVKNILHNFYTK